MLYRFETFEFDTDAAELRNGSAAVPLEPKSFHLLRYLLDNADRVVSKDEIFDHVWRDRVVSETTLTTCIKTIRKALGDSGGSQRLVQTARGHGYRFIGKVSHEEKADTALQRPVANLTSLALLPFQLLSPEPELEFFADGMVEDLTTILAHVPGLGVISRSSSFTYKGTSPAISRVRNELGVSHVIEGSVRASKRRAKINVQLIDANTQEHVWARRFDADLDMLSEAEDTVIREVARSIEPQVTRVTYERVARYHAKPEAQHLYVQASGLLATRGWRETTFLEAAALLQRCTELDPKYALAHALRALLLSLGQRVGLLDNATKAQEKAIAAADAALQIGDTTSEVLGFIGCALCDVGDLDRGLPLIEKAVQQDPSNAQAWAALGAAQQINKQFEESARNLAHGIELSPLDSRLAIWASSLAATLVLCGDIDGAIARAESACRYDPTNHIPHLTLAAIQCALGNVEAASSAYTAAVRNRTELSTREMHAVIGRRMTEALIAASIHEP